jgi:hypothetical protein
VARDDNARELQENGADIVVTDLAELNVDKIDKLIESKLAGRLALAGKTPDKLK